MTTLDIGCGTRPLHGNNIIHADIQRLNHVEIICDIQNLPFKSKSLSVIYASHVLEHVQNPVRALNELKRVTSGFIVIKVPNAQHYKQEDLGHLYSWNPSTLRNLLTLVFSKVKVTKNWRFVSVRKPFVYARIREWLGLMIHSRSIVKNEITATMC